MPTPEEVTAWSPEELEAEIQDLLPAGWTVDSQHHPEGYWSFKLQRLSDQQETVTEHEEFHADQRMALLNVFGWLWFRRLPKPTGNSPWVRQREVTREYVTSTILGGSKVPDPEDLDPVEVDSVYRSSRK